MAVQRRGIKDSMADSSVNASNPLMTSDCY